MTWLSSAPANTMIMGEHSVVYGYKAMACALDQRLSIEWQARDDNQIHIHSELATHQTDLDTLAPHPDLVWVMAALQHYQSQLTHGLTLRIHSEFDSTVGLGSSAAILAALLGGLDAITQQERTLIERFTLGHQLIQQIQGRGSGTDLAASLTGGMILFQPATKTTPATIDNIQCPLHFSLLYSGYKTPTAQVLKMVAKRWQKQPGLVVLQEHLYSLMGQTTEQAFAALQQNELETFFELVSVYHGLMDTLGVSDAVLSNMVYTLREQNLASKISGSGLGDCVLAMSQIPIQKLPISLDAYSHLEIALSQDGLVVETL